MKQFLKCMMLLLPFSGATTLYAQNQGTAASDSLSQELSRSKEQIATLTSQQHTFIYAGVAVLVLVLVLLFFIYRNYNLARKAAIAAKEEKDIAEQQRLRAEKSEQFEQQFLANMSHEIRTPMNTVLGMTNLTLDTQLTPKQNKYLTAVKKSSENLLVIINNVLDRSRAGVDMAGPEHIQFSLGEQIQKVNDAMRTKAEQKGLALQTEIGADVPDILTGNPSQLNQVLTNLCENAIKFTDRGAVRIIVEKMPGAEATLRFRVVDSGISISADKVGKLFESFHDTNAGAAPTADRTDLELSVAKTLMELEDGEIEVKRGEGSEFFFTITYETEEDKAAASLQGIRILVAEDNEYNQMVITDTLETLIKDVHTDIAENGKMAIVKLQSNDYDIILMDVQMPVLDGLEATEQIRNTLTGKKSKIPIIALTADVLPADLEKCFVAGMNDHIPKPFTRAHLLNTLCKFYTAPIPVAGPKVEKKPAGSVTNLDFLKDFCQGDQATMKKYIDIYLKVTPGNLDRIKNAASAKDYRLLAKTVHAIKAQLNYMGMKETRKLAEMIELSAKEQTNLDELPQLIYKLQSDSERSMEELRLF